MSYSKGQIVDIFEDPITKNKYEGKAILLKRIYSSELENETGELWKVNFGKYVTAIKFQSNHGDVVNRWIYL